MTGRRRKPLDDLKKRRGYTHFKEEALDRTVWRVRFATSRIPYQMNDCTIPIVLLLADRWHSNARAVVFRHRTALHTGMSVVKENVRILAKAICFGFSRWDVIGTRSIQSLQ